MDHAETSAQRFLVEMDDNTYRSYGAVAQSDLKLIRSKSLHHYRNMIRSKSTPAQVLGRGIHACIYEPEIFKTQYIELPQGFDRRTKARREEYETMAEKGIVLSHEDYKLCGQIRDSVHSHDVAENIIKGSVFERVVIARDKKTGILLKGKLDGYKTGVISDLKTTVNAQPNAFIRDIFKYGYHFQAAFYIDLVERCTGLTPKYYIIAVEKSFPYAVSLFEMSAKTLAIGRTQYKETLSVLERAKQNNSWPSYKTMTTVAPPKWLEAEWFNEE